MDLHEQHGNILETAVRLRNILGHADWAEGVSSVVHTMARDKKKSA